MLAVGATAPHAQPASPAPPLPLVHQVSPSTKAFEIDQGWISTFVKMGAKWLAELLYLWSVVAPAMFPDRDFGYKT